MSNNIINRQKILLIVNEVAHYTEYKKILLSEYCNKFLDLHLLFDRRGYDLQQIFGLQIDDSKKNRLNIHTISDNDFKIKVGLTNKILQKIINSEIIKNFIFSKNIIFIINSLILVFSLNDYYKSKSIFLNNFFNQHNFDKIILSEENFLLDTFLYNSAVQSRKIFIYPYTIPNPMEMKGGCYICHKIKSIKGFLHFEFISPWSWKFKDEVCLLLHPGKILAILFFGIWPKKPWVLNYGTADYIIIESNKMKALYLKLGFPETKLRSIGSINDDLIVSLNNNKEINKINFLKKYSLKSKPIILCAFPPNQLPLKNSEYSSYQELIKYYGETLSNYLNEFNVIVTKHPRVTDSLNFLGEIGLKVVDESTLDLVPLADLYIASASATIRWAVFSGIPVINYDMYRYCYDDYANEPGIITVRTRKDFDEQLKLYLLDKPKYEKLKIIQNSESSMWGFKDGKSSDRFVKLILNS